MGIFDNLYKEVDKLFDKISGVDYKKPFSQISQNNKAIEIKIKLPDVNKKDIMVHVGKEFIEVKAEKKLRKIKSTTTSYKKEESYKGFYRKLSLPENVNYEKAKAKFKKDHLIIVIPKKKKIVNKIRVK